MTGYPGERRPAVSVVVVVYNMAREAPRTLYSLSAAYQRDIAAEDYEVIVVDNGSSPPFDATVLDDLEGAFRLIRLDPAPKSPAHALNVGLAAARGDVIGLMVDGARMVTPGLLHFARVGVGMYPRAVVATLGWYLGRDQQRWALEAGYNKDREDRLLEQVNWREDGYRLFDISAADETTVDGWFGAICESNALFLSRENWTALEGVDERFDVPGGGFVNLDLIIRAFDLPDSVLVVLLGEGTFHQLHGGIATNANYRDITAAVTEWRTQYEAIRGRPWAPPTKTNRAYIGALPRPALRHLTRAILDPAAGIPLGVTFDRTLWTLAPTPDPEDPTIAALVELIRTYVRDKRFAAATAVARLARKLAPDEPSIQELLQTSSAWLSGAGDPNELGPLWRPHYFVALGRAYGILGRTDEAMAAYEAALQINDDLADVYVEMARLRMPGASYSEWLDRLHADLVPSIYLEIGIAIADSFARARPPTIAIGVDPAPRPAHPLHTESHIFAETSDAFFSKNRLAALCPGQAVDFAFIDGLHVFAQSLRDFINVEAHCRPNGLIAIHDTMPFDELTQRPDRQRTFYTGDVWKLAACLRQCRPDLNIVTIPASPSGLTLVGNLDPTSRVLNDNYDEIVARFEHHDYKAFEDNMASILNIVPNEWSSFEQHFRKPTGSGATTVAPVGENQPSRAQIGSSEPVGDDPALGALRARTVAELIRRVLDEDIPGAIIAAGVGQGDGSIQLKQALLAHGPGDRIVYLAGPFEDHPPPNSDAVSVADRQETFRRHGLLDNRVVFVKGRLAETLPALDAGPFALIRLDGDRYDLTYVSLEALYPKLSSGGFVIIDDMNSSPPCRQAVFDYRARMGINAPLTAIDLSAIWWRKP